MRLRQRKLGLGHDENYCRAAAQKGYDNATATGHVGARYGKQVKTHT
jgi:hypothetical protein